MELLVVIAIIGILAALLLPALSKAKQSARSATCLANQKQLITAWTIYADEHNDLIPDANCKSTGAWRIQVANLTNLPPAGLSPLDAAVWQAQEGFKIGALFPYAQNPKIIHCPGDPRPLASLGDPGYDSYSIPDGLNIATTHYTPIRKHAEILHTSERFIFIEEFDSRGDNEDSWHFTDTGPTVNYQGSTWVDSPATFHGRSSSFAWADGHVSNHRWQEDDTVAFAASTDWTKFYHDPDPPDNADILFVATGYPFLSPTGVDGGNP